ncbi:MAG TPA: hypothetical protein VKL22_09230 [Actinomycetota bacterium]|nr:hypothetical protein [Actinomycetota bacterium]
MKRLLILPVAMMFLLTAFVPASSAADSANVVFMGQGSSNALDLSVPLLNILPNVLGNLGALGKGITVGHSETVYEGLNNPSVNGLATGVCALLGNNILSLPATGGNLPGNLPALGGIPNIAGICGGQNQVASTSAGDHGSTTPKCQDLTIAILSIKTACASSYSTIDGGRPVSQNNAGVAEINVALVPNVLGSLGLNNLLSTLGLGQLGGASNTVSSITSQLPIVGQLVNGLLGPVLQGNLGSVLTPAQNTDLLGSVTGLLQNVLGNAGNLLTLQLGTGSSVLSNNGAASQETTQAAGAHIGLIANLISIDVGAAQSQVVWNDATGQATADASPAVAHVKVGDPLNLTGKPLLDLPVALPSLNNLLGGLLTQSDQAGNLTLLAGTPLETTIKVASATPHSTGRNVSASSDGVSIFALKGLGASSPSAMDGGLRLRLASSSAAVAGDVLKVQAAAPSLPITGGRTYVFLAGAAVMAVAAGHVLRSSRRLRAKARA